MSFNEHVSMTEQVSVGIQPPAQPQYGTQIVDSGDPEYVKRVLIGTAVTGLVRVEWVQARIGQLIPPNWSSVMLWHFMNSFMPYRYQVDDAQNVIVKEAIERSFEWVLFWEHDVLPPPDALIKINQYMRDKTYPIISGLYYTRSRPSEPLIYRGRGTSCYTDWKPGELVWADGVPTGFLLCHASILRAMWDESETYTAGGVTMRKVFEIPMKQYFDQSTGLFSTMTGTSDLLWCRKVIDGKFFEKAGFPEIQALPFPFPVDTEINCRHINPNGEIFP
jgi:hypothetical protein